ncbi:restriction endonuclease [Chryseobacterium sp.]|uniref:5-methylcytosine restriction system specificity protein McrC n=1 Tax=Chryseobacterium sp. TaxID=1871047 RepID=UPI0031E22653
MEEKWLFDILKDSTLVDNQTYQANEGTFTNYRLKKDIGLLRRESGQWRYVHNDETAIWNFLNTTNRKINESLRNNENTSLVLFNSKDYEHNTEDNFIDVSGIDCQNFTLKTGNLIGYIKDGEYALKISSRFGDNFLRQIIADADGFMELENYGGSDNSNGYEWLLIYLWKIKLKKAYRLGLPKNYVSRLERLNTVRGQINTLSYFINNYEGKYDCKYREHSYDNPATRLIAEVFKKLKHNEFTRDLHPIKNAFIIATHGKKSKRPDLFNTTHFSNPFYSDYNDVIDLSKLILKDQLADFGKNSENSAFFFDISMLFEYYIRKQIQNNGIKLESKFEKKLQIPTGNYNYKRKLIPDLVINHNNILHIFDVKYKNFNFKNGVNREDLFQIHTYVGQYGNNAEVKSCGFIYPVSEQKYISNNLSETEIIEEKMNIMKTEVSFYILFLKIPDNEAQDYAFQFKQNSHSFIQKLLKLITKN